MNRLGPGGALHGVHEGPLAEASLVNPLNHLYVPRPKVGAQRSARDAHAEKGLCNNDGWKVPEALAAKIWKGWRRGRGGS